MHIQHLHHFILQEKKNLERLIQGVDIEIDTDDMKSALDFDEEMIMQEAARMLGIEFTQDIEDMMKAYLKGLADTKETAKKAVETLDMEDLAKHLKQKGVLDKQKVTKAMGKYDIVKKIKKEFDVSDDQKRIELSKNLALTMNKKKAVEKTIFDKLLKALAQIILFPSLAALAILLFVSVRAIWKEGPAEGLRNTIYNAVTQKVYVADFADHYNETNPYSVKGFQNIWSEASDIVTFQNKVLYDFPWRKTYDLVNTTALDNMNETLPSYVGMPIDLMLGASGWTRERRLIAAKIPLGFKTGKKWLENAREAEEDVEKTTAALKLAKESTEEIRRTTMNVFFEVIQAGSTGGMSLVTKFGYTLLTKLYEKLYSIIYDTVSAGIKYKGRILISEYKTIYRNRFNEFLLLMTQSSAALIAIQAYMSFLAFLARYDNRTRIASLLDVSSTAIGYWRLYNVFIISTVLATIDFATNDGVKAIGLDIVSTGSSRMFAVLGGYSVFDAVRIVVRDGEASIRKTAKPIWNYVKSYIKNSEKILQLENKEKMTIEERKEVDMLKDENAELKKKLYERERTNLNMKDENAELKKKLYEMERTILNMKKPKIEPAKKNPTKTKVEIGDIVQWSEKNYTFEGIVKAERKGERIDVELTTGKNKGKKKRPKKDKVVVLKKKSMLKLKF